MNNFGDTLIKLRKEKGLTQEDLAEIFKVSRQSVSKWETNTTFPETEKLVLMAKYFNVSLDSLIISETKNNLELSNVEDVARDDLINDKSVATIIDEQASLEQLNRKERFFAKKRNIINCTVLMTILLILVISIPILINNLGGKTYRVGDVIRTIDTEFQVESVNYLENIEGFEPASGFTYLLIEIEMINISGEGIVIKSEDFKYINKMTQISGSNKMHFFYNSTLTAQLLFRNEEEGAFGFFLEANSTRQGCLVFSTSLLALSNQKLVFSERLNAETTKSYTIVLPNAVTR